MTQKTIDWFKNTYGYEELRITEDGVFTVPKWLELLLINNYGLKSKSKRIRHKVIKKQVNEMIELAAKEIKNGN